MLFIKILLSVLLPPLGVYMEVGLTRHFWINIILTFLGYVPGLIHALYIVTEHAEHTQQLRSDHYSHLN